MTEATPTAAAYARTATDLAGGPVSSALALVPKNQAFVPTSYEEASAMASDFANSGICRFKTKSAVLLVLATANELQIPPTVALRTLYIGPDGTVGMSSDLAASLVMRSGKAEYFRLVSTTTEGAVYETKRVGEAPRRHEFTMAMAKRAGLVKSGGMYDKYPETQLRHRCKMELCRIEYPDVLLNITSEEEFAEIAMSGSRGAAGATPLRAAGAIVTEGANVAEGRAQVGTADWAEAEVVSGGDDPWLARIDAATTRQQLGAIRDELVVANLWEKYGSAATARRQAIVAARRTAERAAAPVEAVAAEPEPAA